MYLNLDEIINKCIHDALYEAKITPKQDYVIKNAQDNITKHLKNLHKSGDESFNSLLKSKGYNFDADKKDFIEQKEKLFKDLRISDEMKEDILNVVNILKTYSNENGVIRFHQIKEQYPNDYDRIIRLKNFIDLKGLTHLYDRTANIPSMSFGINWNKNEDESNLDFNKITDSEVNKYRKDKILTKDETRFLMKKNLVDQYLNAAYGIETDIPTITLSNGNDKLPDNTLIINFTSALNCPAWNECLVKHSCYARQGEKRNPGTFKSNENRSLYWLTTQNDPKLLQLMMDFVKSYCFNYDKIVKHLVKNNLIKTKNINTFAKKIASLPLNDSFFTPEIIEVMKMYKRIDYIRLNENGDFVGQWLVDAWDNEAGIYQPYDIKVSAYTCRHLNYQGIKNIILNVSYDKNNSNGNIARHFIALPEKEYDALDETYGGKNNQLIYTTKNIKPNPQLLYNIVDGQLTPNGKIYYKCPCGREYNGTKISCYQCNLCYNPQNDSRELFVFVKAHGSAAKNLNGYNLMADGGIGISENYLNKINSANISEDNNIQSLRKLSENNGINSITNNAISSTYEHFNRLKSMNESKNVIKITQDELVQMIKESLYKTKGSI